jgi:oxygen-dependent protoporphyrinogen oxidase
LASFIKRRFGHEALERAGQPMIAGIHSGDPERLSAQALIRSWTQWEMTHGSVLRGLFKNRKIQENALFLSFEKGMETLTNAMVSRLGAHRLHLNAALSLKRVPPGQWEVTDQDGRPSRYDALCSTVSALEAARLFQNFDTELSKKLDQIRFESVATLNFIYQKNDISHPLDASGFVVPAVEKKSLTSCIFSSQKFKGRAPRGQEVLRAFVGGAFGKQFFEMNDSDLTDAVARDLEEYLGVKGKPVSCSVARYQNALPQYEIGHEFLVSTIERAVKRHPGLYLAGASFRGTGIANCVRNAELEAEKIAADLSLV